MNPTKSVDDLIHVTDQLSDLLERENAALVDRRFDELRSMIEDKAALSRLYESRLLGLHENSQILEKVDVDRKGQLKDSSERVKGLMEDNERLLKANLTAQQKMIGVIQDAVRSSAPGAGTYSAAGTLRHQGDRPDRNVAVSVDQTL